MKKKAHDDYDPNFFTLRSNNAFVETATVHVIGDKVFIETENDSICLTAQQAKDMCNFLHDIVVRPPPDFS
jgi:hypothetical protein